MEEQREMLTALPADAHEQPRMADPWRYRPPRPEQSPVKRDEPLFFSELKRLVLEVIPRSDVRGIVIRGEGRHFSSGADLGDLLSMLKEEEGHRECGSDGSSLLVEHLAHFRFFQKCGVPVVAAIRGVCLGSALELSLFCHRRVCGRGAVLGLPESTFGLIPGCGGVSRLTSLSGSGRSLELILTGETFGAEEAYRWNIVDIICDKDDVIHEATRLIERITGTATPLEYA